MFKIPYARPILIDKTLAFKCIGHVKAEVYLEYKDLPKYPPLKEKMIPEEELKILLKVCLYWKLAKRNTDGDIVKNILLEVDAHLKKMQDLLEEEKLDLSQSMNELNIKREEQVNAFVSKEVEGNKGEENEYRKKHKENMKQVLSDLSIRYTK